MPNMKTFGPLFSLLLLSIVNTLQMKHSKCSDSRNVHKRNIKGVIRPLNQYVDSISEVGYRVE